MVIDRPVRRMTLRQLLTHSEKCSRDLIEQLHVMLLPRLHDFRDLSRPIRRRSHFPTLMSLANAIKQLQKDGVEIQTQVEFLQALLNEIQEHVRRERIYRA